MTNSAWRGRLRRYEISVMTSGERIMRAQQRNTRHGKMLQSELRRLNEQCAKRVGDLNHSIHRIYFTEELPRLRDAVATKERRRQEGDDGEGEHMLPGIGMKRQRGVKSAPQMRLHGNKEVVVNGEQSTDKVTHQKKASCDIDVDKAKYRPNRDNIRTDAFSITVQPANAQSPWRPTTYRRHFNSLIREYNQQRYIEANAQSVHEERIQALFDKLNEKNAAAKAAADDKRKTKMAAKLGGKMKTADGTRSEPRGSIHDDSTVILPPCANVTINVTDAEVTTGDVTSHNNDVANATDVDDDDTVSIVSLIAEEERLKRRRSSARPPSPIVRRVQPSLMSLRVHTACQPRFGAR